MARFEDDFHLEAIPSLAAELGYLELWEDRLETTSARLDSIGIARGFPCFVEVKLGVGAPIITSIESKIAGALRDYADDRPSLMVKAMKQVWPNPLVKPIIAIIGQSYSRGASEALAELLRSRARQWGFFWGAYELSETGAFRRLSEEIDWSGGSRDPYINAEPIKGPKQNRNPEPALADFMARATVERSAIIEAVLSLAEGLKLERKMRQGFVTLQREGSALVRLYAGSDGILLGVPKELTESMVSAGFERHAVDGAFRWSRFVIESVEEANNFLRLATSGPPDHAPI